MHLAIHVIICSFLLPTLLLPADVNISWSIRGNYDAVKFLWFLRVGTNILLPFLKNWFELTVIRFLWSVLCRYPIWIPTGTCQGFTRIFRNTHTDKWFSCQ